MPERVEDIPGVGPIRARCLRKAGYDTVEALRAASAAQLAAVPGITGVKAEQVVAYLASTPAAPVPATPSPEPTPVVAPTTPTPLDGGGPSPEPKLAGAVPVTAKAKRKAEPVTPPLQVEQAAPEVSVRTPVQIAAVKVAGSAGWLLQSPQADGFRRGMARQLSKLITLAGSIADSGAELAHAEEQALRRLHRLACTLAEATADPKAGPNKQQKLADQLRTRRKKLQKLMRTKPE